MFLSLLLVDGYFKKNANLTFFSDITKPTFLNCITSDLTVELYKAPNHAVPTATDQSGFVQSVTTVPANYRPTHVVPNSIVVTYTAKDGNNNEGTCSFNIQIKGE